MLFYGFDRLPIVWNLDRGLLRWSNFLLRRVLSCSREICHTSEIRPERVHLLRIVLVRGHSDCSTVLPLLPCDYLQAVYESVNMISSPISVSIK
jgi:hypothetical protein